MGFYVWGGSWFGEALVLTYVDRQGVSSLPLTTAAFVIPNVHVIAIGVSGLGIFLPPSHPTWLGFY